MTEQNTAPKTINAQDLLDQIRNALWPLADARPRNSWLELREALTPILQTMPHGIASNLEKHLSRTGDMILSAKEHWYTLRKIETGELTIEWPNQSETERAISEHPDPIERYMRGDLGLSAPETASSYAMDSFGRIAPDPGPNHEIVDPRADGMAGSVRGSDQGWSATLGRWMQNPPDDSVRWYRRRIEHPDRIRALAFRAAEIIRDNKAIDCVTVAALQRALSLDQPDAIAVQTQLREWSVVVPFPNAPAVNRIVAEDFPVVPDDRFATGYNTVTP